MLREDIRRTSDLVAGGSLRRFWVCAQSPGVHAVIVFRFGQWLAARPRVIEVLLLPLYVLMFQYMRSTWGIDIPRSAQIGPGFYVGHYGGIFVSPDLRAGKNLSISQDIALGGVGGKGASAGVPVLGDDVYIAPGARIFGKITIGNNVKIGGNAVVYRDIPDNAIVALDPGYRIISYKGNHPVPDPAAPAP